MKEEAERAIQMFNGMVLKGGTIQVRPDLSSQQGTKLLVFNIAVGTDWSELRDHFQQAGQIAFCGIDVPLKGKGKFGKGSHFFPPAAGPGYGGYTGGWNAGQGDGSITESGDVGEVRFDSASTAQQAIALLHGSTFKNTTLTVVQDGGCRDGSRVLVFGVPPDVDRQDLKSHFEQAGRVEFCGWKGKGFKGGGKAAGKSSFGHMNGHAAPPGELVGEVRFESPVHAEQAISQLAGSSITGTQISVEIDTSCPDGSRVLVRGIPLGTSWGVLKEHFSQVGPVAFAGYRSQLQAMASAGTGFAGKGIPALTAEPTQALPQHAHPGPQSGAGIARPREVPCVGEVIYNSTAQASQAVRMLSGSQIRGATLAVQMVLLV
jgi:RNA recognition motif-containing protein